MSRSRSTRSFGTGSGSVTSLDSQSSSYVVDQHTAKSPAMTDEQWHAAAEVMGIEPAAPTLVNEDARKLSRKVDKRRKIEAKQMTEILWAAIAPTAAHHKRITITNANLFNREPIPNYTPRLDSTANRRIGMLPPRPAITAGYRPQAFNSHQKELQHGLISDVDGAPRDLSKLSRVCADTYWPFLIVEISDASLSAASDLALDATATCNNALMTLASALLDPRAPLPDERLVECVNRGVASFALAVHRKTARLIAHYSDGFVAETAGVVRTFNLENEADVAALVARVEGIFVWGEGVRLRAIGELLEMLDRRVMFSECVREQDTAARGPMDVVGVGKAPAGAAVPEKRGLLKSVIGSSMPSWSRVEI